MRWRETDEPLKVRNIGHRSLEQAIKTVLDVDGALHYAEMFQNNFSHDRSTSPWPTKIANVEQRPYGIRRAEKNLANKTRTMYQIQLSFKNTGWLICYRMDVGFKNIGKSGDRKSTQI